MLHSFLSPLRERLLSYISLHVLYCVSPGASVWCPAILSSVVLLDHSEQHSETGEIAANPLGSLSEKSECWMYGPVFSFPSQEKTRRESSPDCVMLCQGEVMCIHQCCSLNSPHPLLVTYMCLSGLSSWKCYHQQIMLYAFYL